MAAAPQDGISVVVLVTEFIGAVMKSDKEKIIQIKAESVQFLKDIEAMCAKDKADPGEIVIASGKLQSGIDLINKGDSRMVTIYFLKQLCVTHALTNRVTGFVNGFTCTTKTIPIQNAYQLEKDMTKKLYIYALAALNIVGKIDEGSDNIFKPIDKYEITFDSICSGILTMLASEVVGHKVTKGRAIMEDYIKNQNQKQ